MKFVFSMNPVCFLVSLRNILCGIVIAFSVFQVPLSQAEDDAAKQEKTREQLMNIQQQLKQQNIELEQQKSKAAVMEKQVECNWALLQSYQRCQEEFERTLDQQLTCTDEAKAVYRQCLEKLKQ
jgi:uncharacterized membrane-anchored protein YhcB (DUF1043 family)